MLHSSAVWTGTDEHFLVRRKSQSLHKLLITPQKNNQVDLLLVAFLKNRVTQLATRNRPDYITIPSTVPGRPGKKSHK